jgi:hypothetical protein
MGATHEIRRYLMGLSIWETRSTTAVAGALGLPVWQVRKAATRRSLRAFVFPTPTGRTVWARPPGCLRRSPRRRQRRQSGRVA